MSAWREELNLVGKVPLWDPAHDLIMNRARAAVRNPLTEQIGTTKLGLDITAFPRGRENPDTHRERRWTWGAGKVRLPPTQATNILQIGPHTAVRGAKGEKPLHWRGRQTRQALDRVAHRASGTQAGGSPPPPHPAFLRGEARREDNRPLSLCCCPWPSP